MIWRHRYLRIISNQLHKSTSSPPKLHNPNLLTPHYVDLTLKNCSSDLNKLNLFLWFARQPNYFHNNQSFDYMVPVVGRLTNKLVSVNGIVKELRNDGCIIKGQTFLMLLRIYSRGKMYDMALKVFEEMEKCGYTPNVFVRNIVLDVFFKIGDVDKGLDFFEEIKDPNFLTYNTVLCHLYKIDCLLGVCTILNAMVREGFRPNYGTFFMVLDCLCKGGRMREVFRVLGLMIVSGVSLTVSVWSVLIDGFCKVGKFYVASWLLEKMVAAGYSPNIVTYTFLIKGFLKSGRSDKVRSILMTMESKGCTPDLFLYNVLMHGISKLKVFHGTRQAWHDREVHPESYTLSSYFIKSGLRPSVVHVYNDMLNKGINPDGYSYAGLLSSLCRSGNINYACRLYRGLFRGNLWCLDAHIPTLMTDELIKAGRSETAIMLFKEAVVSNVQLDAISYTVAIKGLIWDGRLEEALNLYEGMQECGIFPNTCTCNYMLLGFCKTGDINLIISMVREMVALGIKPDCGTIKIIMKFLEITYQACSVCKALNSGMKCNKCRYISDRIGDAFMPLLKVYSEDMLSVDNTSSEDVPDVVDSFG
ncbi:non-specific serine/threonine protein kinase [Ranunculus cassubicifolius]